MAPATLESQVRQAIAKALGDTVVPSAISGVAQSASVPAGLVAVPRIGGKPIATAPNVPLEFTKLFSSEDGEDLRQ
jgi:hypothetical protein